ncbi:hypothetical protein [Candidatus Pelagibacter sp. HIMB1782]|uniref:hypothetical protein n=1 Tax=Candidatus Pelagibacter sp. HIMB1782 TaxID=3413375 RepID=UPI003F84D0D3
MKEFKKILQGLIRIIKLYGLTIFVKILIYELFYYLRFNQKNVYMDESHNRKRVEKNQKIYNSPSSPTPYYFISLIYKKILINYDIKSYHLYDFGCGSCRVINFFYLKKVKTTGIDIIKNYKKYLIDKKKQRFLNFDIRKQNITKYLTNNNLILYFYEPFEINLVLKILKSQKNKRNVICVLVNYKIKKIENFRLIYELIPFKKKGIQIFTNINI